MAVGVRSACALDRTGIAWCWGDNTAGQLGDGRVLYSASPVPVAAPETFSSIALSKYSGGEHFGVVHGGVVDEGNSVACGLSGTGAAYCWGGGANPFDLGNAATPTLVADALRFTYLGAASGGACGLTPEGAAWCWPATWGNHPPVRVGGDLMFRALAVGRVMTCGLTVLGVAYCWGYELWGNGQIQPNDTLVPVTGGLSFSTLTGGDDFMCGLTEDREAWCWGQDSHGQLGDGSNEMSSTDPVRVRGELQFTAISSGMDHTCALTPEGQAWCWGFNNKGQLGDGSTETRDLPVPVATQQPFVSISGGFRHTCALTSDGDAWCWGWNRGRILTEGDESLRTPVRVADKLRFRSIASGGDMTCGISDGGQTVCWGYNYGGELGDGHMLYSAVPVRVAGNQTFTDLSAGGESACGVTTTGEAACWGTEANAPDGRAVPVRAGGALNFTTIGTGGWYTCGIATTGAGWCWTNGQPSALSAPLALRSLDVTAGRGCGITTEANAYCWESLLPNAVENQPEPFAMVAVAQEHACALALEGKAYCWGANQYGQLGDGTRANQTSPAPVVGELRFSTISAGNWTTCAVTFDMTAYCWSIDPNNQGLWRPGSMSGDVKFKEIAVSHGDPGNNVCGVTDDYKVYCWGENTFGQVGNGSRSATGTITIPTQVLGAWNSR